MNQLEVLFKKAPTQQEFEEACAQHINVEPSAIDAMPPKKEDSKVVWMAFPKSADGEKFFFICFPVMFKNDTAWRIAWVNKTQEEEEHRLDALATEEAKFHNNALNKLNGIKVKSAREIYDEACSEAACKPDLKEVVWERTGGKPCNFCNKPAYCKVVIHG